MKKKKKRKSLFCYDANENFSVPLLCHFLSMFHPFFSKFILNYDFWLLIAIDEEILRVFFDWHIGGFHYYFCVMIKQQEQQNNVFFLSLQCALTQKSLKTFFSFDKFIWASKFILTRNIKTTAKKSFLNLQNET